MQKETNHSTEALKNAISGVHRHSTCTGLELGAIIVAVFAVVLLAIISPPKHTPDGNIHYLVTLLLSQGEISSSVEGTRGPLLSWLMVPFVSLGFELPTAFRTVSCIVFSILLWECFKLGRLFRLSPVCNAAFILFVALQLSYYVVAFITADLLAAALFLILVRMLCEYLQEVLSDSVAPALTSERYLIVSVLIAACYYAKAFQGFIALALVATTFASTYIFTSLRAIRMRLLASCLIGVLLMIPWFLLLSKHYESFTISGQQQIGCEELPYNDYTSAPKPKIDLSQSTIVRLSICLARRVGKYTKLSLNELYIRGLESHLSAGGADLFLIVVLVSGVLTFVIAQPLRRELFLPIGVAILMQISAYLLIWGAQLRYYFPILPFVVLLYFNVPCLVTAVATRYSNLNNKRFLTVAGYVLWSTLLLAASFSTLQFFANDWGTTKRGIVEQIVIRPELEGHSRGVASNLVADIYPPLVAYKLRRPFFIYIQTLSALDSEQLADRLRRDDIEQIIWSGDINETVEHIKGIIRAGPFQSGEYQYYIYTLQAHE